MIKLDENIKKYCCGCEACKEICPIQCIQMEKNEEGFFYPVVDESKCIGCNLCDKVCLINRKTIINREPLLTYASWNKNDKLREESTSGGIFVAMAEEILSKGGIVIGCKFDKNNRVVHDFISEPNEIYKFKGSKYIQSSTNGMYKIAKKYLEDDKKVLYTGTPCQIEGLKLFLRKDYKNLITCSIVCKGVPSPGLFEKYINILENQFDSKLKTVNFRKKDIKENNSKLEFEFNNKVKYRTYVKGGKITDLYYKGFCRNIFLRKSCFFCKHKLNSDITIGDFWGIENHIKDIDINKGVSLLLINNEKGKVFFSAFNKKVYYKKENFKFALIKNPYILNHVNLNYSRNLFFKDYRKYSLEKILNKYLEEDKKKISIYTKIFRIGLIFLEKLYNLEKLYLRRYNENKF